MKKVDWFNQNPKAKNAWLHRMNLKPGEIVLVCGRQYRYSTEREGRDSVLTPVEGWRK